jgi:hypothetical protein
MCEFESELRVFLVANHLVRILAMRVPRATVGNNLPNERICSVGQEEEEMFSGQGVKNTG